MMHAIHVVSVSQNSCFAADHWSISQKIVQLLSSRFTFRLVQSTYLPVADRGVNFIVRLTHRRIVEQFLSFVCQDCLLCFFLHNTEFVDVDGAKALARQLDMPDRMLSCQRGDSWISQLLLMIFHCRVYSSRKTWYLAVLGEYCTYDDCESKSRISSQILSTVIKDDNSCLFNHRHYAADGTKSKQLSRKQVYIVWSWLENGIAQAVVSWLS